MAIRDGDQGPNIIQSYNAIEEALLKNHRTWDQLPEGYKDVLKRAGYEPATFNQTELARNGTTDVSWSLEDPFNKAYLLITAGTIGFTVGFTQLVGPSISTCVAVDCADNIQRGITVLGRFPKYLDVANDIGGNVFNLSPDVWANLSEAEQWALNQKFLDDAIANGDIFYLANRWLDAVPGTSYLRELEYLFSQGYTLSIYQNYLIPSSGN